MYKEFKSRCTNINSLQSLDFGIVLVQYVIQSDDNDTSYVLDNFVKFALGCANPTLILDIVVFVLQFHSHPIVWKSYGICGEKLFAPQKSV